jgi:hypothetical protein
MRHRLRVLKARTLAVVGFIGLVRALVAGQVREVWVGDSNAAFSATDALPRFGIGPAGDGRWVWHLGPRLMHSLAKEGFPPVVIRAVGWLHRVPAARRATWIFSAGEIDLRCHLVPRLRDDPELTFVGPYLQQVQGFVSAFGGDRALVAVPTPPAVDTFDHTAFPVVGTPAERLAAHRAMRAAIHAELAALPPGPRVLAIDATDGLSDESGLFRPELTIDGVHATDAGRAVIHDALESVLAGSD